MRVHGNAFLVSVGFRVLQGMLWSRTPSPVLLCSVLFLTVLNFSFLCNTRLIRTKQGLSPETGSSAGKVTALKRSTENFILRHFLCVHLCPLRDTAPRGGQHYCITHRTASWSSAALLPIQFLPACLGRQQKKTACLLGLTHTQRDLLAKK